MQKRGNHMSDFDKYQRTAEGVKERISEENRSLARRLAEKEQSFELVKMVHFDKSIDLVTLNDIIIGCTGCLHSVMFYQQRVITNMNADDTLYEAVLKNKALLTEGSELYVSDSLIPGFTTVMYPVSSSQMLSASKAFVKNIVLLYPTRFVNQEVLDFVKSFMIVNEVLINIVLTREKMVELIETDPLTKALNRSSWKSTLKQIVQEKIPFFILFIDIDNFKNLNDTLGHQRGDDVLKFTGTWAKNTFRGDDRVFRLGGDEFAVTGRVNLDSKEGLINKFNTLNHSFKTMIKNFLDIDTSISIGALIMDNPFDENEVYTRVDSLLYLSKKKGRDTISIVSELNGA